MYLLLYLLIFVNENTVAYCFFMLVYRALTNVSKINNVLVNVEIKIIKD